MVSKTSKFRGSRTHGRGKKAGRGAGLRGGRGNAGLHKHKWISVVKYCPDYFGHHGFKRPQSVVYSKVTMNLSDIEQSLPSLSKDGFAVHKDGKWSVDLTKMGIDKLLGSGRISTPIAVKVAEASASAEEKLKKAGGKILKE
ncbi:MAG: uL15 family ribosomal protein [Thermoplasmatota archaeon]|nr:50S ribosomal protein L15 [Candidatus Thermoplasmatota archaeon]MBU1914788.1 50S ribosomal protein L15 [Candidatus Thermoplasmatota archaeon]